MCSMRNLLVGLFIFIAGVLVESGRKTPVLTRGSSQIHTIDIVGPPVCRPSDETAARS